MNPFLRLVSYLRESKVELEKVAWPSKQDVIRYSGLVVVASFAATLFFGTLDTVLHGAITAVISRRTSGAQTTQQANPDIQVTPIDTVTTSSTAPAAPSAETNVINP